MSSMENAAAPAAPTWGRGLTAVLAVLGALAPAAIVAGIVTRALPLAAVPAVTFGVPAMTAPALYVALTLFGDAPPMTAVAGAVGRGLIALALVQLGLAAPLGFLVATATPATSLELVRGGALVASVVAIIALDVALAPPPGAPPSGRRMILWAWIGATALIAARLYGDVLAGAVS